MNLKKDLAIVGGLFIVVVVLLVFGKGFTSTTYITQKTLEGTAGSQDSSAAVLQKDGKINLTINTLNIFVEVADTKDKRKKGLSKKDDLPIGEGMLFVFEKSGLYTIWMKDMNFPIDIIWIDENKKIVDIVDNALVEPNTKDRDLKRYIPKAQSIYILEINAGLASLNNLEIGDQVEFGL